MRVSRVAALGQDAGNGIAYFVVLDEPDGDRHLVILIGEMEALGLASTLSGKEWPRPMTYQFMAGLIRALDGRVQEVRLDRLADGVYAATVKMTGAAGTEREVDARASDALNLAVLSGAPVFIASELLDDFARLLADESPGTTLLRRALTAHPVAFVRTDEYTLPPRDR